MLSIALLYLNCVVLTEAFFFGDEEPAIFCIKVCPLYCPTRRRDDDASSLIYVDEPPSYIPNHHESRGYYEDHGYPDVHEVIPYHFDPYYYCKPQKSTTTPSPTTTTTEEPTLICMICTKNCTKYPKTKKS